MLPEDQETIEAYRAYLCSEDLIKLDLKIQQFEEDFDKSGEVDPMAFNCLTNIVGLNLGGLLIFY